ncbi:MAG: serine/threonine protein kinase [Planctomycetes bacterium]|nr:serine/threonine protein kinase [Planctomycetota bacterium]
MDPVAKPVSNTTLPERIGEFRIVEEIGRGGMGVVYRAEQESLEREVALKVVARTTLGEEQFERFEREARTAAQLHHTNIVPVFAVGQHDGVAFYAMQLIHGESLDDVLGALASDEPSRATWQARFADGITIEAMRGRRGTPACFDAAARCIHQVACALSHAHAQGVLHRDVKPGNLLLDDRGTLWLSDFGLARRELDPQLTRSGEVVGTLKYLAPEALRGKYDERSDLYALGMTFYELLTWHPPFEEKTPAELLLDISKNRPRSPRSLVPNLPHDLETIVQTAIAPDRAHRYASVDAFREDLEAYLEGRPIRARRIHLVERFVRWARRNPVLASLTGTIAFLLLLVLAVSIFGYVQIDRQRAKAEANLRLALEAFEEVFAQVGPGALLVANTSFVPAEGEEEIAFPPIVSPEYVHVLEKLLGFYERFAESNADDPKLRLDMARAHQRVGDIHLNFGEHEAARESYHRALEEFVELADTRYATWEERVEVLDHLSWVERLMGERDAALGHLDEAMALLDGLGGDVARSRACRLAKVGLATTAWNLLPMRMGASSREVRFQEVLARRDEALRLARTLVAEDPQDANAALALARLLRNERPRRTDTEEPTDDPRREAIAILETLVRDHPLEPEYQHELSLTLTMYRMMRRGPFRGLDRADLERAVAIDEKLVASYPTVPRYALTLAQHRLLLGEDLVKSGDRDGGDEVFQVAVRSFAPLVDKHPGNPAYDLIKVELETRHGQLVLERRSADAVQAARDAVRVLEHARQITEGLAEVKGALSRRAVRLLIQQNDELAEAHAILGEPEAKERALRDKARWEEQANTQRPRGRSGRRGEGERGGF